LIAQRYPQDRFRISQLVQYSLKAGIMQIGFEDLQCGVLTSGNRWTHEIHAVLHEQNRQFRYSGI